MSTTLARSETSALRAARDSACDPLEPRGVELDRQQRPRIVSERPRERLDRRVGVLALQVALQVEGEQEHALLVAESPARAVRHHVGRYEHGLRVVDARPRKHLIARRLDEPRRGQDHVHGVEDLDPFGRQVGELPERDARVEPAHEVHVASPLLLEADDLQGIHVEEVDAPAALGRGAQVGERGVASAAIVARIDVDHRDGQPGASAARSRCWLRRCRARRPNSRSRRRGTACRVHPRDGPFPCVASPVRLSYR